MPSLRTTILAVAAAFVASARADYFIDPESVSLSTRKGWCQSEKASCPAICKEIDTRPALVNECDPEQLTYGCICGNGQQPDIEQYSLTLPYFTCTEFGNQCVANCGSGNSECQRACREDNPCGAQNPTPPNSTATTTAATSSSTSDTDDEDTVFGSLDGEESSAVEMSRTFGLAAVLGCLFAGFAML